MSTRFSPFKRCLSGSLGSISAAFLIASLASPVAASASSRRATAYTTEGEKGGWIYAQITYSPNPDGKTYHGTIQGAYEDLQEDGHCVLGMRSGSGGQKWYPLGPGVCPKGASHRFVYHFKSATKAAVQVCRLTQTGQWINCSGAK